MCLHWFAGIWQCASVIIEEGVEDDSESARIKNDPFYKNGWTGNDSTTDATTAVATGQRTAARRGAKTGARSGVQSSAANATRSRWQQFAVVVPPGLFPGQRFVVNVPGV